VDSWIDNHCHIPGGSEGDAWVEAARSAGVSKLITVGVTVERSREAIAVAQRHDGVYATVGVHPHDAKDGIEGLAQLLDAEGVVAVGECGLDYFYDHSPRDVQQAIFAEQIALAHTKSLPLVIHTRDAWNDTFAVLDSEGIPPRTVFHCFTGGPDEVEMGLERGIFISVSGIVTFENAIDLQAAVRMCPIDTLMVETDSPYLSPVPHRGKKNEPANVVHVGSAVADLLEVPVADMARTTSATATHFYDLI
jgi:TatD DNase family protein